MSIERKEDLIEQYEAAAFALMMSEYAEQEGLRLLQEFEEAKAKSEVPVISEELDKKCRTMIHKAYKKERIKERTKCFLSIAGRTAAVWFVVIGLCATLIVSVEALRTPVINYIIEQHDQFTTINLDKEPSEPTTQSTTEYSPSPYGETPLDGLLPDGYNIAQLRVHDNGTFVAQYKDSFGNIISLSSTLSDGHINIDTENANARVAAIGGFSVYIIENDSKLTFFWFDAEQDLYFHLWATNASHAELWKIAESYILNNKGGL